MNREIKDRWHVMPIDDLREHIDSIDCWCKPTIKENGSVVVHNSLDGREYSEPNNEKYIPNLTRTVIPLKNEKGGGE